MLLGLNATYTITIDKMAFAVIPEYIESMSKYTMIAYTLPIIPDNSNRICCHLFFTFNITSVAKRII